MAYAVQENFEYNFEVTVWPQGVFDLSRASLEALDAATRRFDAAVFVFRPDDVTTIRGADRPSVRDNVVFELGLFVGRLGRDKCFIVQPRSFTGANLPSDLLGITPALYDTERQDANLVAALGPACNKIRRVLLPKLQEPSPDAGTGRLENLLVGRPFRLVFNPPKYSKRIVFAPNGMIVEGNNQNEHSWRLAAGKLELLQLNGLVHSRFSYYPTEGMFRHTNDTDTLSLRNQYITPEMPDHHTS